MYDTTTNRKPEAEMRDEHIIKIEVKIELLLLGTGDDNIYIDNIRRGQA